MILPRATGSQLPANPYAVNRASQPFPRQPVSPAMLSLSATLTQVAPGASWGGTVATCGPQARAFVCKQG
jgi:hypothetical protein